MPGKHHKKNKHQNRERTDEESEYEWRSPTRKRRHS